MHFLYQNIIKVVNISPNNIFDNQKFLSDQPAKDPIKICDKFKVMRISLKQGMQIPTHAGPHPVFFLVLKGKGIFTTAEGEVELNKNEYVFIETNVPRGIKSLEDLIVLAVRD